MKFFVWLLLALPAAFQVVQVAELDAWTIESLRPVTASSGEYAAWLIVLVLCITPLSRLLRGHWAIQWLRRHRRNLGVAAFGYSVLHTVFFFAARGWEGVAASLHYSIITGWVALIIMLPLAATSNDTMVRKLGPSWKRLQRWAWIAGAFTFLHWVTLHRGDLIVTALLSFLPLLLLLPVRFRRRAQGS